MKLSNNPTRRQERRLEALKRWPPAPQQPDVSYIQGDRKVERITETLLDHAKRVDRWRDERNALTLKAHAEPIEYYRGLKTKKDRTARAKFGRNA